MVIFVPHDFNYKQCFDANRPILNRRNC